MTAPSKRQSSAASAGAQMVLSILDQGVSSVTNFGVVIVAAIALPSHDFGLFSVVYILTGLVVGGVQAIIGQELVLTRGSRDLIMRRCREAVLFAATLGGGVGVAFIAFSWLFADLRDSLVVASAGLPFLLVQDTLRYCASLLHKVKWAVISDLLWLAASTASILGIHFLLRLDGPGVYVAAWVIPGGLTGIVLLPLLRDRSLPRPSLRRFCSRSYIGYRFAWEFLALRASSQVLVLLLGAIAGVGVTGAFRGATTLFGPLTVLILATTSFGAPIVSALQATQRNLALFLMTVCLLLASLALTGVLWLLPADAGHRILGSTWLQAHDFVLAIGAQTAFTCISTVTFLALRIVEPRATLALRIYPAALMVPLFFSGLWIFGPSGAAWAIALTSGIQCLLAGLAYSRLHRSGRGIATIDVVGTL